MQTINELSYLVEMGTLTKEAAERILLAVTDSMKDVHGMVCNAVGGGDLEKTADAKSGLGTQLMTGLLSSIGLTLGGMGVNYLAKEWDKSKTRAAHNRSFHEMHRVRPEINQIDPVKTQEYFSVLADTAPDLAKNPFIAANFVERQAQGYGGVGFEEAGALARANESLARAKGPSMISQIGEGLTQQGITQIGGNVGYVTRLGIDEQFRKSPEEIGKEQGIIEETKDLHLRQSGMADRVLEDKEKELALRDSFARDSEERKHEYAKEIQGMKSKTVMDNLKKKHKADMTMKQMEHEYQRAQQQQQYDQAQEQYANRWGGKTVGSGISQARGGIRRSGPENASSLHKDLLSQGYDVLKKKPVQGAELDYTGIRI